MQLVLTIVDSESFTGQELRDLKEERDDELYFAAENEVDRDMPELDGEARYQEIMKRIGEKIESI